MAHPLPALGSWKCSCIPKVRELRPLHHPTAQEKKTMRMTHLLELGRIRWEWRRAFDTPQFYCLSALESRITYFVSIKSQVQSIFASFQDSNLLEGSVDWRSPPLPTAMVGLQHSWAEVERMAKQRFPLAAPPADPVSATYRHPSLSYQCLFLPTTLPIWAEKGLPRFWHFHVVVLSCQQRW